MFQIWAWKSLPLGAQRAKAHAKFGTVWFRGSCVLAGNLYKSVIKG